MSSNTCPEYGSSTSEQSSACKNCGSAFDENHEKMHAEVHSQECIQADVPKKHAAKKTRIIVLAIAVAVIIIAICGVLIYKTTQAAKTRAAYIDTLQQVRFEMLDSGADAESLCNLTRAVWYNTIFEKSDPETDPYAKNLYVELFNDDFNESISRLYASEDTQATITQLKLSQEAVAGLFKQLQNPTEELKPCYETALDLYASYSKITGLAISPSGNLEEFTEEVKENSSDFMKHYERLEVQLPSK